MSIPERVNVDVWLAANQLAQWGERGRGWSECREPVRELFGPGPGCRDVTVTVDARSEPEAAMALERATSAVEGTVLAGPLRATTTPEIAELARSTNDLVLDAELSLERAGHLAEQGRLVSELMTTLSELGYTSHPAVAHARRVLERAALALSEHEPVPGLVGDVGEARRQERQS
ncbi:MAG TPA: hypothetical protein VES79_09900 [Solirubrobacteraceae bacterium]|nr:hypothetical protein [Solirubrobacteraceae bacterium]